MVNNTEEILSAFSKMYFYNELVQDELKFTPIGHTEVELADMIVNLGEVILAIQLKARDENEQTDDITKEMKWLDSKSKKAKKQVKDTIEYITNREGLRFKNGRNQFITINPEAKIIPLVVFMNKKIEMYPHVLKKHTENSITVNCMSYEDFQTMCELLVTPIEIIQYLEYRQTFYEDNGNVDCWVNWDEDGMVTFLKPMRKESLVYQFLYDSYGMEHGKKEEIYLEDFRLFLHNLPEHTDWESEDNASFSVIKFLAHLNRVEIKNFWERLNEARRYSKCHKENKIVGTLRNTQQQYIILFVASDGNRILDLEAFSKMYLDLADTKTWIQVIVYWENSSVFRVDFNARIVSHFPFE